MCVAAEQRIGAPWYTPQARVSVGLIRQQRSVMGVGRDPSLSAICLAWCVGNLGGGGGAGGTVVVCCS